MKLLYISLGNGGLVSINVGHIPRDKFQKDAYTFVSVFLQISLQLILLNSKIKAWIEQELLCDR